MGEVYLATDSALGRRVAIKILPAALQSDAKMRGRFMNEARAVAALNHPNVITIHDLATTEARDVGFPPGALYLVLEYLEGEGLDEIMDKRRLSITECLDIAIQALEGLKVAHQSRILHRDVTPSNLMLAPDGRVKVLDFGLSKLLAEGARDTSRSHRQTGEGMIVGTLDYLSPEQALGNPLDERSDLFSFGIVFYQMLAGVHPFSGASVTQMVAKMMTKEADPWPEPDLVPETLKQIVAKALRKEPLERYGSAGQMILDLVVARRELRAKPARSAITREVPPFPGAATAALHRRLHRASPAEAPARRARDERASASEEGPPAPAVRRESRSPRRSRDVSVDTRLRASPGPLSFVRAFALRRGFPPIIRPSKEEIDVAFVPSRPDSLRGPGLRAGVRARASPRSELGGLDLGHGLGRRRRAAPRRERDREEREDGRHANGRVERRRRLHVSASRGRPLRRHRGAGRLHVRDENRHRAEHRRRRDPQAHPCAREREDGRDGHRGGAAHRDDADAAERRGERELHREPARRTAATSSTSSSRRPASRRTRASATSASPASAAR